jgi:hypothetical protein
VGWALTNGPSADDLASAIPTTGIAFLAFLLAAQLLVKTTASGFIRVHMAVNRFMANTHLICDLLWTPLFMQAGHRFIPVFGVDLSRITGA